MKSVSINLSEGGEPIKLSEFDAFTGMFELRDVEGIETYVSPIENGNYISRSSFYYARISTAGASEFREELKGKLTNSRGKKAMAILDYMANLSAKVYYEEIQRAINSGDYSGIADSKACLLEDISNIIATFEKRPATITELELPKSTDMIAERPIECDNKALLYLYSRAFEVPENFNMLNAGLGGIFIGPFFQAMHGIEWTNVLKSKYVGEQDKTVERKIMDSIVEPEIFDKKNVLFIDDNVGTGDTMREIVTQLMIEGFKVKSGAVLYNWDNFYKVWAKQRTDIRRFQPQEIDYVTQFNLPGHKYIKDSRIILLTGTPEHYGRDMVVEDQTPGKVYVRYKKINGFCNLRLSDFDLLKLQGLKASQSAGISISAILKGQKRNTVFKKESVELMKRLDDYSHILDELPMLPDKTNSGTCLGS